ncbi:dienelactone hydrolase family protein [Paraburkholderia dipogonis]|uniref:Dienelactone hydrolase family protein n=1 Tax=Paraburkholderia dipogonis TaxID=1211383 RepID=A0A4Y8MKA6_9BURK|nr:dienelactone hydrolase family protein [Paraburkholderia dipogonis]TFE37813.1 dienelactone hydrolase family protein [Paraburkholderia dipogonis]
MNNAACDVLIPVGHEHMGAYFSRPGRVPIGGVVLIQEIFGVTPAMRAIADDLSMQGYAVAVPDIYWRLQRGLDLGNGESPVQRQLAVEYAGRFDECVGTSDIVAAVDWLNTTLASNHRPSVFGFCLGGRMAVRVAATTELTGMVSMYGVGLEKMEPEITGIKCPVQFHFGEDDNHNPMSTISSVAAIVDRRRRPGDEFFTYPSAQHAFYNRFRSDRFNPEAHKLAQERVLHFLAKRFSARTSNS